jgi:hypothetical protein
MPWHRRFFYMFESMMRDVLADPTFAFPYWDPTATTAGVVATDEVLQFLGGDGTASVTNEHCHTFYRTLPNRQGCNCSVSTGSFASWRTIGQWGIPTELSIQRSLACFADILEGPYNRTTGLPTAEFVTNYTTIPSFDEGIQVQGLVHTPWHEFFGQTMFSGSSPSDPAFWFLHSW